MEATPTAIIAAAVVPTSTMPTILGFNSFEFWSIVIGVFSTLFGFFIAVIVFVLGLQVYQQNKLREKAEKEYDAIRKVAKDMTTLRNEHKKLLTALVQGVQEQAKDIATKAKEVSAIKENTQEAKQKIEKISKEIEEKAEDLRGSVINLGDVSSLGTISGPTITNLTPMHSPSYTQFEEGASYLNSSRSPSKPAGIDLRDLMDKTSRTPKMQIQEYDDE